MKLIIEIIKNFLIKLFKAKQNGNIVTESNEVDNGVNVENVDTSKDIVVDKEKTLEEKPIEATQNNIVEKTDSNHKNVKQENIKKYHILIDNGHGVETSGKRSPYSACKVAPPLEYYEYKWSRLVATEIVDALKKMGFDARRIVTEENDVSLGERVRRVNDICTKYGVNNVILVSIHSNACGNGAQWMSARGWSAYTTKGKTKSDELCECLYREAEKNFKGMQIRKDLSDSDMDLEENFYILKNTKCPAVLSENFFHDNVEDVKFITSSDGRKKVVATHINGIIEYIKKQ